MTHRVRARHAGLASLALAAVLVLPHSPAFGQRPPGDGPSDLPREEKFNPARMKSTLVVPVTRVERFRYPVLDAHSHPYAKDDEAITSWVGLMDQVGSRTPGGAGVRAHRRARRVLRAPRRAERAAALRELVAPWEGHAGLRGHAGEVRARAEPAPAHAVRVRARLQSGQRPRGGGGAARAPPQRAGRLRRPHVGAGPPALHRPALLPQ